MYKTVSRQIVRMVSGETQFVILRGKWTGTVDVTGDAFPATVRRFVFPAVPLAAAAAAPAAAGVPIGPET